MTTLSALAACHSWQAAWPLVRIFDPDQDSLDHCQRSLAAVGCDCTGSTDWEAFLLEPLAETPDCALISCQNDIARGIALAAHCRQAWPQAGAVLLVSGLSMRAVVEAMRSGVDGVLEMPLESASLFEEIAKATTQAKARAEVFQERYSARAQVDRLPASELEVLRLVAGGVPNKNIALRLNVAVRTVEKYRHSLFDLLGVNSAAEATRLYVLANLPSYL